MQSDVARLIELEPTSRALSENTSRLSALLRRLGDPDRPAIGTWTIGDVANHVTYGVENYALWLEDKEAPDLDAIEQPQNLGRRKCAGGQATASPWKSRYA